jgi:transcriptional regulator with XRE-family HTH domain
MSLAFKALYSGFSFLLAAADITCIKMLKDYALGCSLAREKMQKNVRFKERLNSRRNRLGLTQEALAERAGVSVRSISDYERGLGGSPNLDQISKLAAALGVNVGWLIGEDECARSELKDSTINVSDPESVRLAFRVLKSQIGAVAEQIGFYERQLCGPEPPSSSPLSEAGEILKREGDKWDERQKQ